MKFLGQILKNSQKYDFNLYQKLFKLKMPNEEIVTNFESS
jgi:hypothetical protein